MSKGGSAPTPDPNIGAAALKQAELGEEYLSFAKDAFAVSQERQAQLDNLTSQVTTQQLAEMERLGQISREDRQRYEQVFRPIEDQFVQEAQTYDTPERQQQEAAKARADVQQAAAAERGASERRLAGLGVNPASGRYAGIDRAYSLGTGLASVGAENEARDRVRKEGLTLRGAAIDIGRGLPASSAAASQLATSTGTGAAGVAGAANSQYIGSTGIVSSGYQGAQGGYAGQANTLLGLYDAQLSQYRTNQAQANANASGIGNLIGTGVGLGLSYLSSKDAKMARERLPEGEALAAVEDMPVDTFNYKAGMGDRNRHVGPMAEDFQKATGAGDGSSISVQDAIGITMGAIKDLASEMRDVKEAVGLAARRRPAPGDMRMAA